MSYSEYLDMFEHAQRKKSQYLMCIFDIKNSKKGYNSERCEFLILSVIQEINKKYPNALIKNTSHPMFGGLPRFRLGDLFGFVVDPQLITEEEVLQIFKENKKLLKIQEQFHYNSGYFETYDWVLGNKLYYFGYCIQELEARSKKTNKII